MTDDDKIIYSVQCSRRGHWQDVGPVFSSRFLAEREQGFWELRSAAKSLSREYRVREIMVGPSVGRMAIA